MSLELQHLPRLSEVRTVRIAVEVESIVQNGDYISARRGRDDYMHRIRDAVDEGKHDLFDLPDGPEPSEYESEWEAFHGTVHLDLTPDEWTRVCEGMCIDLAEHDGHQLALPNPDYVEETLGILSEEGILPAVALTGTDQGWGIGSHQPSLIASFYVGFLVSGVGADRNALDAIQELLSGTEWGVGDLETIAEILRSTGRTIEEPNT